MGKLVNVVLWNGTTQTMPEEAAQAVISQNGGRLESPGEEANRARSEQVTQENDNAGGKAIAALSGAADTLSLGLAGAATKEISPETGQAISEASTENPGWRGVGEVAGALIPGTGEIGLGQNIGHAAEAAGGQLAGRVAEGAAFGIGGDIAHTNVTGDPLTIEGAVASAGFGALLNVGVGALADKMRGAATRAKLAQAVADAQDADAKIVASTGKLFSDTPPSWEDFRQSWAAKQKATAALNKEIQTEIDAYNEFVNGKDLREATARTSDLIEYLKKKRYADISASRAGNIQWIEGQPRAVMTAYDTTGDSTMARQILAPSKAPMTDEYFQRMRDLENRMSGVLKLQSGNYDVDATGKWIRAEGTPANPQKALEELRSIQDELKGRYPGAVAGLGDAPGLGKYGDLPAVPRQPVPMVDVSLPKSLREFARKRSDTIDALAKNLDGPSEQTFNALTQDLGLDVKPTIADTVDSVHHTLGSYIAAADRLEAAGAEAAAKEAQKPWLLRMANRTVRYAASRYFDVGGVIGAATRAAGGEAVGRAMTGIEDSVLGAGLLQSRQGVRSAVRNLVAKYGTTAGNKIEQLGPVAAWLAARFPDGTHDDSTDDPTKLAVNRANDLAAAQPIAPDAAFTSLQGFMGAPNDIAFKLHQHLVNGVNHLAAAAPKDPGLDTTMFGSNWTPSWHDAMALAYRLEAAQSPLTALARALSGDSHPAAADTLWAMYPAIMQEVALEFSDQADSLHVNYERGSMLSQLFRTPMTGLQQPAVIAALQGMHLPQIQPQAPSPNMPSASTPLPTGRPPAVQSSVAGSNVSGLIS